MKSTFEEMGGTYRRVGDYYLPNIAVAEEHYDIGKYGRMHHRYLKEHREILYNILVLNGTLFKHLHEIDTAANERMELLIRQMAERQGVNEELKHRDQMGWVRAMNTSAIPRHEAGCWLRAAIASNSNARQALPDLLLHACAEEIVLAEVVYA